MDGKSTIENALEMAIKEAKLCPHSRGRVCPGLKGLEGYKSNPGKLSFTYLFDALNGFSICTKSNETGCFPYNMVRGIISGLGKSSKP